MRRGRKRIGGPVLAAAGADSAVAASAIAQAAPVAAGTRDNGGNPAGNRSRLKTGLAASPAGQGHWGGILWLVDQAQRSRSGRRNWLARISSAKKRPRGNSASSTR